MYYTKIIYLLFITIILESCASQIPLTGGEKDNISPTLVSSDPDTTNNINFSGNIIQLTFSEQIQDNNLKTHLVIQPEITNYTYKIKKRTLTLQFQEPLIPNTTYSFNFGSCVKDYQEGLTSNDINLYLSTGPYLDSINLSGNINDNSTGLADSYFIGLYANIDSILPTKHLPLYFTNSTKDGLFQLKHLPNSTFKLFAFQDLNKNKLWDPHKEKIAFLSQPIYLNSNKTFDLITTIQDTTSTTVKSIRRNNYDYIIKFNRGITTYTLNSTDIHSHYITTNRKELHIFPNILTSDSIPISVTYSDSLNQQYTYESKFFYQPSIHPDNTIIKNIEPSNFILKNNQQEIIINNRIPLDSTNSSYNSITLNNTEPDSTIIINNFSFKLLFSEILQDTNLLNLPSNCIKTYNGLKTDSLTLSFYPYSSANFGNISGNIPNYDYPLILELLDKKNNVVQSIINPQKTYHITNLTPGTYKLRIIHDYNSNQQYDNGNIYLNSLPETIQYYPKDVLVRANWDLESINFEKIER